MIHGIMQQIKRTGLIHPNTTPFCSNLVRHIKLFYLLPEQRGLFVKITNGDEAKREYLALKGLSYSLANHVARPLMFVERTPHTAFVTPLLKHRPIILKDFRNDKIYKQVSIILESQFLPSPTTPISQRGLDLQIKALLETESLLLNMPTWTVDYIDSVMDSIYQAIPQCPQHSDLTLYNLGIHNNSLILFDWEDYGRISFAGFDIATFVFSLIIACKAYKLVANNPSYIFQLPGGQVALAALQKNHIPLNVFTKFFPFFILCFLYLKKEFAYGLGITQTTIEFLKTLFASHPWKAIMLST